MGKRRSEMNQDAGGGGAYCFATGVPSELEFFTLLFGV